MRIAHRTLWSFSGKMSAIPEHLRTQTETEMRPLFGGLRAVGIEDRGRRIGGNARKKRMQDSEREREKARPRESHFSRSTSGSLIISRQNKTAIVSVFLRVSFRERLGTGWWCFISPRVGSTKKVTFLSTRHTKKYGVSALLTKRVR